LRVKIFKNEQVAGHAYKMTLAAPVIAKFAQPGQFVMVKCADGIQPLLRRPLGVHNVKGSEVEILYEIIGEGTKLLSQKKSGQALDIIGPLGIGFKFPKGSDPCGKNILIAGGMGVAPLLFLAKKINKSQVLVLIGAKTKQEILCKKEFKKLGCNVKVVTDDGSAGHKGFVTDLLQDRGHLFKGVPAMLYACGPKPMLKAVSEFSKRRKIPAQISFEEHMACGIGACLGCIVNTKSGQKRVCKEGPVFDAREIIWE